MIMMTDLEFVLRRINWVVTGDKSDNDKISLIKQLINQWADEISSKLD